MTLANLTLDWKPLTLPQLDFWEEFNFHQDKPVSTVAHYLELSGVHNEEAFLKAVSETISEAEVLSTRFRADQNSDEPMHCIDPSYRPEIEFIDLQQTDTPIQKAQELMERDAATIIDLRRERISRQIVFRLGEEHYIWYVRAHHIIVDGYSLTLIEQRCGQLYNHYCGEGDFGHRFESYYSFLAEEEAYIGSPRWEKDQAFWNEYLCDADDLVVLDKGSEDYGAAGLHFTGILTRAQVAHLHKLASQLKIGWPDLLILTSGAYLLHNIHQKKEPTKNSLIVWLPFMSRWGSVGAHMPAMMVNILPFRIEFYEGESLQEFLQRHAATLRKQRKHGRYRIEQIATDLHLQKGTRFFFSPLINVIPFNITKFNGCSVNQQIISSGVGDGINLTFRSISHDGAIEFYLDADQASFTEDQFNRHCYELSAFLEKAVQVESSDRFIKYVLEEEV